MGAGHGASANIERRAHPFIYRQRLGSDCGANNVYDCVDRADFVEMHLLDRGIVNLCLGCGEGLKDADRSGLCAELGPRKPPSARNCLSSEAAAKSAGEVPFASAWRPRAA